MRIVKCMAVIFGLLPALATAGDAIVFEQQRFGPALDYIAPKNHPEPTTLNVLVWYHTGVRGTMTDAAWQAHLDGLFATANDALQQSGTNIELAVTGHELVNFDAASSNVDALMTFSSLAEIEDQRAAASAHLVTLLRPYQASHLSCGSARLPACGDDAACYSAAMGFSTVSVDPAQCGDTGLSIAHQLAHNLGAAHESGGPQIGAYPYSHAHTLSDGRGTVMSASAANGRIARFSSPSIDCDGEPCGVDGVSDNARTLEQTRHYVSRWMTDRSITVGALPASVTRGDSLDIDFEWFGVVGDTFNIHLLKGGAVVATLANQINIPATPAARAVTNYSRSVTIPVETEPGADYGIRVAAAAVPSVFHVVPIEVADLPPASILAFSESRINATSSSVTVSIERTGDDVSKDVSVEYRTAGGSAHAGINFTPANGIASWPAGDTTPRTFQVTNLRAAESGNAVSIFIGLINASDGARVGTPQTIEIVIPASAGGGALPDSGGGGGAFSVIGLILLALIAVLGQRRRPAPALRTVAAGVR